MKPTPLLALLLAAVASAAPEPKFRAQEIDKIEIGYGLAIADVDGDGKPDIILADKTTVQWYQNPTWKKHVIAENLTKEDNVCVAARDLDGDGKAEIAIGAGWNPSDTVKSGAVFYLIPPADRTQKWEAVKLHHEPTTHRMQWVEVAKGRWDLVVQPLHGVGNKAGAGAGAKLIAYEKPAHPKAEWKMHVINDAGHMTHNLHPVRWDKGDAQQVVSGSKEGHAVACADFLGTGSDQVMVGWRGADPGIRLLTPLDDAGKAWRTSVVSTKEIAVEDFKAADLDGDGKPDLIVAGRQTKNLMIFWNAR